jgi:hypothetical protein
LLGWLSTAQGFYGERFYFAKLFFEPLLHLVTEGDVVMLFLRAEALDVGND